MRAGDYPFYVAGLVTVKNVGMQLLLNKINVLIS